MQRCQRRHLIKIKTTDPAISAVVFLDVYSLPPLLGIIRISSVLSSEYTRFLLSFFTNSLSLSTLASIYPSIAPFVFRSHNYDNFMLSFGESRE